jgi:mRNA-degrading endonuclease RelE of RelBE toxin-antitoxin system
VGRYVEKGICAAEQLMFVIALVVAYLSAGLLLALGALINGIAGEGKRLLAFVAILLVWPLFALAAPEAFFAQPPRSTPDKDPLSARLDAILASKPFGDEELLQSLRDLASEGERSVAYFGVPGNLGRVLEEFWDHDIPPGLFYDLGRERAALRDSPCTNPTVFFSLPEPDWFIGFSHEFLKCIGKADGKMRGRVLDAIAKISVDPTTTVGDTIKPLKADLAGMWRCRIGDDRLIYLPDPKERKITLISFGARGSIYD